MSGNEIANISAAISLSVAILKKDKRRESAADASTRRVLAAPTWKLSVSHTYFSPAAILIFSKLTVCWVCW